MWNIVTFLVFSLNAIGPGFNEISKRHITNNNISCSKEQKHIRRLFIQAKKNKKLANHDSVHLLASGTHIFQSEQDNTGFQLCHKPLSLLLCFS